MNAKLLQSAVSILVSILITFIAWQSAKWSQNIESLTQSVIDLNLKMQVLVTEITLKNENTSNILRDHEGRIRHLEKK